MRYIMIYTDPSDAEEKWYAMCPSIPELHLRVGEPAAFMAAASMLNMVRSWENDNQEESLKRPDFLRMGCHVRVIRL